MERAQLHKQWSKQYDFSGQPAYKCNITEMENYNLVVKFKCRLLSTARFLYLSRRSLSKPHNLRSRGKIFKLHVCDPHIDTHV